MFSLSNPIATNLSTVETFTVTVEIQDSGNVRKAVELCEEQANEAIEIEATNRGVKLTFDTTVTIAGADERDCVLKAVIAENLAKMFDKHNIFALGLVTIGGECWTEFLAIDGIF